MAPHRKPLPLLTFERPRSATKLSIVGEPQIVTLTYLVQHYFHRPQPWFQTPVACLYFHCQRRVLFPAPRSTIPFEARCLPSSGEIRHMRQGSRCSSLRRPSHGKPPVERTPLRTPAFSLASTSINIACQGRCVIGPKHHGRYGSEIVPALPAFSYQRCLVSFWAKAESV